MCFPQPLAGDAQQLFRHGMTEGVTDAAQALDGDIKHHAMPAACDQLGQMR